MVPGEKPPDFEPSSLFTVKQDAKFKCYPRTAKFCIHVKNCNANISASFCAILSGNCFLRMKK